MKVRTGTQDIVKNTTCLPRQRQKLYCLPSALGTALIRVLVTRVGRGYKEGDAGVVEVLTEMGIAHNMATISEPEGDRGEGTRFLDKFEMAYTAIDKFPEVELLVCGNVGHRKTCFGMNRPLARSERCV